MPTFTEGAFNRTTNSVTFDQNKLVSTTLSNTLRYNWDINRKHNLKFLAGTEYIKTDFNFQNTRKEGFATQTEEYFTISAGTGNSSVFGGSSGNRLFSLFSTASDVSPELHEVNPAKNATTSITKMCFIINFPIIPALIDWPASDLLFLAKPSSIVP